MLQLLIVFCAAIVAIFLTTGLFYECLCLISRVVTNLQSAPRIRIFITIIGVFIAHIVSIVIYAFIYWILIHYAGFSDLLGNVEDHFPTYLYFSATTYSSLGVGDVFPRDALRFLTGIEAINGLILITWSAAFTYLTIRKMWEFHEAEAKKRKQ